MLTIKKLKAMKPHTIFAKGEDLIVHPWFNNATENLVNEKGEKDKNGKYVKVKFVACRGGIHDWAIYHSLDANLTNRDYLDGFEHLKANWDSIQRFGAKLHNEEDIKKIVECDDESFNMYRH